MATNEDSQSTIVIGIDFGTTYSGVAFTWSNKADRIEVITSWKSEHHSNADMEKAPTAIAYGKKGSVLWGYSIPDTPDQLRWFKLLLIDSGDLPESVRESKKLKEARKFLKKHNKTPVEVISLYLRHLWNHTTNRITETVGRQLVNFSKFHIVITLPAIWPSYAQVRMREAAREAGMLGTRIGGATELSFISEPEAAALATLFDLDGRKDIKKGDSFVVVDCGGGTVDIISYQMTNISPIAVEECVKGQGDLCGAVFVDEAFAKLLKSRFTSHRWNKMTDADRHNLLTDEWEHGIKTQFDGGKREWKLTVPFDCYDWVELRAGIRPQKIAITSEEVQNVFDPVVKKIAGMVDAQVSTVEIKTGKDPKYVILVGGFGRSRYLFNFLKERLGNDIEVLQSRGSAPWTAICRGAVIYALSAKGLSSFSARVATRISRASYGMLIHKEWDESIYEAIDKVWDDEEQGWFAKNQMDWFLKNGDAITPDKRVKFAYRRLFDTGNESTQTVQVAIHTSSAAVAPNRFDGEVRKLCTITWDAKIDITSLPTFINPLGKVFYKLEYQVEMTVAGGFLDFAVYHNGKRQGSQHVVVDYS